MKRFTESRLLFSIVLILAVSAVLAVGTMLIWLYQPTGVLEVHNTPFPVRTIRKDTAPDGVVILTVDYCKKVDVKGIVRLSFVSSTREIFLPMGPENSPKGCQNNVEFPIIVPKDLAPDTYHVHFRATYKLNPLRNVTEQFDSKSFKVAANGQPE